MVATSVDFIREQDRITVNYVTNSNAEKIFDASITLNNEGRCKLKVNEIELELWQVRRLALEKLFFGSR